MENYLRRVRVDGLFSEETKLVVDFNQSINCIHGVNGTGKTVLINLIVSALKVNISELIRIPFFSITILIAAAGKNQAVNFLTISKSSDEIYYVFHNDYEDKSNLIRISKVENKVKKNILYKPDSRQKRFSKKHIVTEKDTDFTIISLDDIRAVIHSQISLTYVPLLRHSGSFNYRTTISKRDWFGFSGEEISDEIYDPNIRVLKELQEEVSRRYASAQSVIARKLESLSSDIFRKLLFGDSVEKDLNKPHEFIRKLLTSNKVDQDDSKIESVISQINDLSLDISEAEIRDNYKSWIDMQKKLLAASREMESINDDTSTEDRREINSKYSNAYFDLLASQRLYKKLEEAIIEIQKVHLSKQLLLGPFNQFTLEINRFLSTEKEFSFDDSGEFVFKNRGRVLDISNLSSGEKHLVAILGRVCFFSGDSTSTFIADEPELSLHLEWQREILPAIKRLSPETQIIVATHAPAIISKEANRIDIEECYKDV